MEFECTFVPDWRSRGMVQYTTPPLSRGLYRFERTLCTTEDIFGLFQHHGTLQLDQTLRVYPRMVTIKEWSHYHDLTRGNHLHSTSTRAVRETTQINGVRDYVYGDRISRIHWNATARTGTWKSKEFEKETLPKTVVVLDREYGAYPDDSVFELAVSVTASLFQYGFHQEMNLGMLSSGKETAFIEAARGEYHFDQVLNHLIVAARDGHEPLVRVIRKHEQRLGKGSFFILVSPRRDESIAELMNWARARQLHACHIWTHQASRSSRQASIDWESTADYRTYAVSSLGALPVVLGGRGI